jgi:replicative superfamily II helicase
LTDNLDEDKTKHGCIDEETIKKTQELIAILTPLIKGEKKEKMNEDNQEDLKPVVEDETLDEELDETEIEKEVPVVSDEPIREEYESFSEYADAVTAYNTSLKAKKPITEKELDEKLSQLKEDIMKMLEEKTSDENIGEVVKKSVAIRKTEPTVIDYESKKKFLGVA